MEHDPNPSPLKSLTRLRTTPSLPLPTTPRSSSRFPATSRASRCRLTFPPSSSPPFVSVRHLLPSPPRVRPQHRPHHSLPALRVDVVCIAPRSCCGPAFSPGAPSRACGPPPSSPFATPFAMSCASALLTTALAAVCLCGLASAAYTCYSEDLYKSKIRTVRNLARKTDMGIDSVRCLYNKGMAFQPEMVEMRPGVYEPCYKDTAAVKYMVDAMAECIDNRLLTNEGRQEATVRRRITPDTPLRSVAHWLGLEETVRTSCECFSGCHYCCVQTGIGGHDYCFATYCASRGYCRWW